MNKIKNTPKQFETCTVIDDRGSESTDSRGSLVALDQAGNGTVCHEVLRDDVPADFQDLEVVVYQGSESTPPDGSASM